GRLVSYRNPHWDEKEGEEEVYIDSAGPVIQWKLDESEVEYLGEGVVSLAFEARLEVSLDRSSGDPYYDDLYATSGEATADVDGAISLILEHEALKRLPSVQTGAKLLDKARLEL